MKVITKNNFEDTHFGNLCYGDAFIMMEDDDPCVELYIKTEGGNAVCVQDGRITPMAGSDPVYVVEAAVVVGY